MAYLGCVVQSKLNSLVFSLGKDTCLKEEMSSRKDGQSWTILRSGATGNFMKSNKINGKVLHLGQGNP